MVIKMYVWKNKYKFNNYSKYFIAKLNFIELPLFTCNLYSLISVTVDQYLET